MIIRETLNLGAQDLVWKYAMNISDIIYALI